MSKKLDNYELKEKRLTISEIKKYPGLESLNEEEAITIIEELYQLSLITYFIYQQDYNKK